LYIVTLVKVAMVEMLGERIEMRIRAYQRIRQGKN